MSNEQALWNEACRAYREIVERFIDLPKLESSLGNQKSSQSDSMHLQQSAGAQSLPVIQEMGRARVIR
jgi:hypothetical protein